MPSHCLCFFYQTLVPEFMTSILLPYLTLVQTLNINSLSITHCFYPRSPWENNIFPVKWPMFSRSLSNTTRYSLLPLLCVCLWGCPQKTPLVQPAKVKLKASQTLAEFGQQLTAGAGHLESTFVAGTPRGEILLITKGTTPQKLSQEPLHDGAIRALSLSGDGKRLLSIGGKAAAVWHLPVPRLIRQVRGPQKLSAGVLAKDGTIAYFATQGGHVLRWSPDQAKARAISGLNCTSWKLTATQMALPEEKRCKFGIFLDPEEGPPMCSYPVTTLLLHQGTLIRACREGSLGFYDLTKKQRSGFLAGHLQSVIPLDQERLLLCRHDGILKVYSRSTEELSKDLASIGPPTATASSSQIIAVAHKGAIALWAKKIQGRPTSIPVPSKVIWLGFSASPLKLLALLENGRLVAHSLQVVPAT